MSAIIIKAFAKINLGLHVRHRRSDGYHEIETLFQSIDLADIITLERRHQPGIELIVTSPWDFPQGRENLVFRAAELMLARARANGRSPLQGVRILLNKRIPIGAGLGGGSSDAAATLVGLNELFERTFSDGELHNLALELGSDVPYFLVGGLCRGRGRGELLEKLPPKVQDYSFVLVKPDCSLSTEEVYREHDRLAEHGWCPPPAKPEIDSANDLEEAAMRLCPDLCSLREALAKLEPELWGMSGSGPTYYAAWRSEEQAQRCTQQLAQHYTVYCVRPTDSGYELAQIPAAH